MTYMKKVAKYLGGGPDSDEQMTKVFEFETKLAKVSKQIIANRSIYFPSFIYVSASLTARYGSLTRNL